jgi:hypothetical protein
MYVLKSIYPSYLFLSFLDYLDQLLERLTKAWSQQLSENDASLIQLRQARYYSLFIALHIKADAIGSPLPRESRSYSVDFSACLRCRIRRAMQTYSYILRRERKQNRKEM